MENNIIPTLQIMTKEDSKEEGDHPLKFVPDTFALFK